MKDLKINLDPLAEDSTINGKNDLIVENFDLHFVEGTDYIRQQLKINLQMFQGEYFLNTSMGLPYFTEINVKNPNLDKIDAIFKSAISSTKGVISIDKYVSTFDNSTRKFNILFTVTTDSGILKDIKESI